jgi:sarcosine/dimethylglycine N-methyltransferase
MAERTEDVQAHWTRSVVLARIDAALTELEHDPQNLNPEILATLERLHSGGLATTRRQANRVALSEDSRVFDVGCGIGGPARYLARTYGCRVDGIDLTPELIETGRVLTERCKLADRVAMISSPPKLSSRLIFGDDAPERQRNSQRNLIEKQTIYWMITAERPRL